MDSVQEAAGLGHDPFQLGVLMFTPSFKVTLGFCVGRARRAGLP